MILLNYRTFLFALAVCGTIPALASTIVIPGAQAAAEGNSNNAYPLNLLNFDVEPLVPSGTQRYQQVYGASAFSGAVGMSEQLSITGISFRPDGDPFNAQAFCESAPPASCVQQVQISLSTTSKQPDGLDLAFANNIGSAPVTVFSGPLLLTSHASGGPPRAFDIVIPFTLAYLYDPQSGNLLLDMRVTSGALTTQIDSQNSTGDAISRVFSTSGGVNASTGDFADSEGLVTRFTFNAVNDSDFPSNVPEPAASALVCFGLCGLAVWKKRLAFRLMDAKRYRTARPRCKTILN